MTLARARQLTLSLPHPESWAADDFLAGAANEEALTAVEVWPDWPADAMVFVGPEGSGKTHLAAIWAERAGARCLPARALNLDDLPDALATGALVVEDLDRGDWSEQALFHALNLVREQGGSLLLTARSGPAQWGASIADLRSRLKALPVVRIAPPDRALMRAVLVKLFADRQLAVDERLIGFLAENLDRSLAVAKQVVAALDAEALRLKRPINRYMAASFLQRDGPHRSPVELDPVGLGPDHVIGK